MEACGILAVLFIRWILDAKTVVDAVVPTPSVGYMIALLPDDPQVVANALDMKQKLKLREMHVVQAVKSNEVSLSSLLLYTRYQMDHGRTDHMQIATNGAVGCFLSHAKVWFMIHNQSKSNGQDDTAYVFEEDAMVKSRASHAVVQAMLKEIAEMGYNHTWSMLFLHFFLSAGEESVVYTHNNDVGSSLTATCRGCTGFSTSAYVLHKRGAAVLLKHYHREKHALVAQVDSWIGLVNTYDPRFRMFWSNVQWSGVEDEQIIKFLPQHESTVQTDKKKMRRFSWDEFRDSLKTYLFVAIPFLFLIRVAAIVRKKKIDLLCLR